jgi:peroxiredoxin
MLLPDTTFYTQVKTQEEEGCAIDGSASFEWKIVTTKDLFAGKRVIIFGLPGAFTPTCSNNQLPGYEKMFDLFREKGIDEIWCTSVNDAFVMEAWARDQGLVNVKMLPDGNGDFAKAIGMLVKKNNLGFGERSWRYAMLVDDLDVVNMWAEEGGMHNCPADPYQKSAPEAVLAELL